MNNFPTILKAFLSKRGMTQMEFAEQMGWNRSVVSNYKSGLNSPNITTLNKIKAKFPDFPIDVGGQSDLPWSDKSIVNEPQLNIRAEANPDNNSLNLTLVPLKAYGGFLSGYANRVFMDSLEYASFPFVKGKCFGFEVDGFSMFTGGEDSIKPGDYVIATEIPDPSWLTKGRIYVFQTIDGLIVKVFEKVENELYHLSSLNPQYNPVDPIPVKAVKKVYYKEYVIKK